MVNVVWLLLIAGGIACAAFNGKADLVTQSAISAAEGAVTLAFKLIGIMSLWLGIMKIAEKARLIEALSMMIGPLLHAVFPSVPRRHPAMGAIIMTAAANMLGMGNAVTPLGIKAMQELQKLNPRKDTASPAMCTLLGVCTAGFTLIPATIIALRSAAGSVNPTEVVGPTILVSLFCTTTVLVADWICRTVFGGRSRG